MARPKGTTNATLIQTLLKEGRLYSEIMELTGCVKGTIGYHRKKLGLPIRNQTRNLNYKICPVCKTTFYPDSSSRKSCSKQCSAQLRKAQRKRRSWLEDIPASTKDRKIDKNIGYARVYYPEHPESNTRGYVYEHRVLAEAIIERRLLPHEVVHHKNGIRWDNLECNLEVMDKKEHSRLKGQRPEDLNI